MTLEEISQEIQNCKKCSLYKTRTHPVPGEGNPKAEIMLIGEGPGYNEDLQGRPFVGTAGKFLEELLSEIDLKRENVFIGNILKCRPPQNRDPQPQEIAACIPYLKKQINIIKPKLIVTLGRYSLQEFLPGKSISEVHGKVSQYNNQVIFPMYHPAGALYRANLKQTIKEDMKKIPKALQTISKLKNQK
jgi:DNA polymerase